MKAITKKIYSFICEIYASHTITNAEYIWKYRDKALNNPLFRFKYYSLINKCNSYIPLTTNFANMPTFPHGLSGIFISQGAKIGMNCVIFHQVTIGSNTLDDSKHFGSPTIGNNVFIGCGAKIIGNVTIGNNVRIGANCIITEDVQDNCTVVMDKPRIIIKQSAPNNAFIPY